MTMFSESLRAFLKPVAAFLDDPEVSEILINGPREVWVERHGKLQRTEATFSEDGLLAAARNMAQYVGRPLTEERPRLDARLPDGSRIHVVLAPIARRGTTIAIRKFFPDRLTAAKLLTMGSLTPRMARLLEACVGLRLNMVVAGGTGSGKTSLLNVLSQFIAPDERILTIEDSAELQLTQPHIVSFESRPADKLGKGEVNIGDLLHSALRLRPDEKGEYRTQDLLVYETTGKQPDGRILGHFTGLGVKPSFFARLAPNGYGDIDAAFFDKRAATDTDPEVKPVAAPATVPEQK